MVDGKLWVCFGGLCVSDVLMQYAGKLFWLSGPPGVAVIFLMFWCNMQVSCFGSVGHPVWQSKGWANDMLALIAFMPEPVKCWGFVILALFLRNRLRYEYFFISNQPIRDELRNYLINGYALWREIV